MLEKMLDKSDWIYVEELSEHLLVSDKTIYLWIKENRMQQPIRFGKMRWLRSDIENWVRQQSPQPQEN